MLSEGYYITMGDHPCGVFSAYKIDERISDFEVKQMEAHGNYFITRDEAYEMAETFNNLLRANKEKKE